MREIVDLTAGWRFHKGHDLPAEVMAHGNLNFIANETKIWQKAGNHALSRPDNPHPAKWRLLDLPHDFVLEGEFTPTAALNNGSLPGDCAWYVKHFSLPACDHERRISVAFDGVYRDCQVFCNGHFVGRHMSGYTSFSFDITEVCEFGGENAIAVHVDARENELWSYEGGGIYRGVRLVKTAPIHIPQWGVCVRTGGEDDPGRTDVEVTVRNRTYDVSAVDVKLSVLDGSGNERAAETTTVTVDAIDDATGAAQLSVEAPELWSIESPTCYTLIVELAVDGNVVDRYEQVYGYRYFRFDAATGFYLNGQPLKLKGTCCHQDSGCVGVAVPADLQAWRVGRLKSYGCNAIRTSHNPPDPALLDACDRLGMLVMDEVRVPGISREQLEDVEDMVRRDRNHPSVILWSLGNEEMTIQQTHVGPKIFGRLQHAVKHLDPTRPTIYGCNCNWIEICDVQAGHDFRFDVWGANYRSQQRSENYDDFHAKHPEWPLVGTETWGGASTRGLYADDRCPLAKRWLGNEDGWADDKRYVSGYANWCTPWGYSIEEMWQDCTDRPFMAGTFIWTGFDYRGETSPYGYPAVITRYGVIDLCGFYKPVAHYLRSWWRPDDPHIFLLPHWNWEGREGETIDVHCYANAAEVELFLNGVSLGRRAMPVNGRLDWNVPYAPGELRAVGYATDGSVAAEVVNRTAGPPAALQLHVEREGSIAVVSVSIVDEAGTVCPLADDDVTFDVTGPARLLGVGNGNPISHEPDQGTNRRKAYHGLCQAVYRSNNDATLTCRATADGLRASTVD